MPGWCCQRLLQLSLLVVQARDAQLMEDEGSADEEFWQQEFFAEERKDDAYEESTEEEDVPDEDFSEAVSPCCVAVWGARACLHCCSFQYVHEVPVCA